MTVTFRLAKNLHSWLVRQAKRNHRSLNAEVEYRLLQMREAETPTEDRGHDSGG